MSPLQALMKMLAELPPQSSSNVPNPAGLASHRQNKSCPPHNLSLHSRCFPNALPPISSTLHVLVSPYTPPPHTVQTDPSPPLPYENCNKYTSFDRTGPARKFRAFSSHKNSSTSLRTRALQLSFFK